VKAKTTPEHKWARLYRRVRSDQMSSPDRLAEYDPVQNIVFINALAYDYAPEHEKAAVLRHSTFE
jgi:hypothetical protein